MRVHSTSVSVVGTRIPLSEVSANSALRMFLESENSAPSSCAKGAVAFALSLQHEHHAATLRQHNSRLPVNDLPNELLCLIFEYTLCLSDGPDATLSAMCRVCTRWRMLIIGTPTMWRHISYDSARGIDNHSSQSLKEITACLQRSQGVPIDIDISIHFELSLSPRTTKFFSIIKPHLGRCRALRVVVNLREAVHSFFPLLGPLPFLEVLQVTLMDHSYPVLRQLDEPLVLMNGSANRLRVLHTFVHPSYRLTLDKMLAPALVSADIDTGSVTEPMLFAKRCPGLRDLELDVGSEVVIPNDYYNDGSLSLVESLVINGSERSIPLSLFTLPHLLHLRLHAPIHLQDAPVFPFLISLSIEEPEFNSTLLSKFIRSHPTLVALQLICEVGTADVLRDMSLSRTPCLPMLRLIRLTRGSVRRGGGVYMPSDTLQLLLERNSRLSIEWRVNTPPEDVLKVQERYPGRLFFELMTPRAPSDHF